MDPEPGSSIARKRRRVAEQQRATRLQHAHFPMTSSPSSPSSGVPQDVMGSERNRGMQCANPPCSKDLVYLREGRLWLLELESHADDQSRPDDGAFAMRSLPSKFFWLCGECAKTHIVKRWTTSGLVVVLRNQNIADSHPDLAARPATTGTTRPLPLLLPGPPMCHLLDGLVSLVLRRYFLDPKAD